MSSENIQKALDSINQMIFKICLAFVIAVAIVTAGFSVVIMYNTHKTYDYEYEVPDIDNMNISGNNNKLEERDE